MAQASYAFQLIVDLVPGLHGDKLSWLMTKISSEMTHLTPGAGPVQPPDVDPLSLSPLWRVISSMLDHPVPRLSTAFTTSSVTLI